MSHLLNHETTSNCSGTYLYLLEYKPIYIPRNSQRNPRNRSYFPRSPRDIKLPFLDSSNSWGMKITKELPSLIGRSSKLYFLNAFGTIVAVSYTLWERHWCNIQIVKFRLVCCWTCLEKLRNEKYILKVKGKFKWLCGKWIYLCCKGKFFIENKTFKMDFMLNLPIPADKWTCSRGPLVSYGEKTSIWVLELVDLT